MIKLVNKDYKEYLKHCKPFRMAFADPPDNLGLKYDGFDDKFSESEYEMLLHDIVYYSLKKCDVIWLSLNSRHALLAGHVIYPMLMWNKEWEAKACVQTFKFGQHNQNDLGNNHRLLYRLMKRGTELYPDTIRVPSWRQLNGDKRADPRGRVPGDVFERSGLLPIPNLSLDTISRFLAKIDIQEKENCWDWTGSLTGGYGCFRVGGRKGKVYKATRLLWRLVHGTDPSNQIICHTCDNPKCCNPSHLFLGSDLTNARDKETKKRGNHPRGEQQGAAKLTESEVTEIFLSHDPVKTLCKRFGVSRGAIDGIQSRKTWNHVTGSLDLSDVFRFPRICGNFKQRRKFSPTQLHEGLYERCIKLCCAPGDLVVDLFAGSGTLGRVAPRCKVDAVMVELSEATCKEIAADQGIKRIY